MGDCGSDFAGCHGFWATGEYCCQIDGNASWLAVCGSYASRPDASIDLHLFVVLRTLVNVLVWVVGVASALNSVGFEVSAVLAGLGIGGMALASQDTVANIFGGVLILLQRPLAVVPGSPSGHSRAGDCRKSPMPSHRRGGRSLAPHA